MSYTKVTVKLCIGGKTEERFFCNADSVYRNKEEGVLKVIQYGGAKCTTFEMKYVYEVITEVIE